MTRPRTARPSSMRSKTFGEEAVYGEGYLFVRIPPGPAGQRNELSSGHGQEPPSAFHPFSGIEQFESEEGVLETAIRWLGYIAAVAGRGGARRDGGRRARRCGSAGRGWPRSSEPASRCTVCGSERGAVPWSGTRRWRSI